MIVIHRGRTRAGGTPLGPITILLIVFGLFPAGMTQAQNLTPVLSSDSAIATAGYFRLSWETDATWVELQEAQESTFQTPYSLYAGPDQATVISGKPDGIWYYRVRGFNATNPGQWSDPVTVTVHHHSLLQALLFFALGLTVFIATLAMIIQGTRMTK